LQSNVLNSFPPRKPAENVEAGAEEWNQMMLAVRENPTIGSRIHL